MPSAGCPSTTAAATSSSILAAPSSIENSVWVCRWTKLDGTSPLPETRGLHRCDSTQLTAGTCPGPRLFAEHSAPGSLRRSTRRGCGRRLEVGARAGDLFVVRSRQLALPELVELRSRRQLL